MALLIPYLIKLSISLAVVYLFYQLFLRRLTFYNWNRWYLLIYSLLSFFIPFINIYPVLEKNNWDNSGMLELIPVVSYPMNSISITVEEKSIPWTYQDSFLLFISIGIGIMLIRLVIQQLSYLRIRRSSTLLLNENIKVYQVNKNIIPFSYGNSIFVNQHLHTQEELKEIIRHEFIHVKQKHTMDILCAELLCILNWYNPFAWLIRKSVRQNLEFIADHKVLQNGIDKKEYQYLLLKVIGVSHFSVATQFNFSSLKKRIAMMNKIKSAKVHLIKFLFLLPLMAVLLLAFRNKISDLNRTEADEGISGKVEKTNAYADITVGQTDILDTVPGQRKLPDHISQISISNDIATVKLKNGKVEKYNLNNEEEELAFEKKYGKWMPPPPPPPAKPGKAPAPPQPPTPRTEEHVRVEQKENSKGYIVTVADNNGECVVIIKDKDKKIVKAMLLTEWNDHEFENAAKYGEIPSPPPAKAAIPAIPVPANPPAKARVGGVEVVPVPAKPVVPTRPFVLAPGNEYGDLGIITAPSQEKFYVKPVDPFHKSAPPSVSVRYKNMNPNKAEPIYIIDGVRQPVGEQVMNKIDPDDIESISISKDASTKAMYGGQAAAGVVSIKTKKGSGNKPIDLDNLETFEGLIILDGEEVKKEQLNERVKPEDIESVHVLKNEEATKAYGEKGKKGVILIRTKAQKDPVIVSGVQVPPGKIIIFKSDHGYLYSNEPFHGIYIIDGNEYSEQEYKALQFDPNTARNVNCYSKGQGTVNLFGERGRNGVMVISTQETRPGKSVTSKSTVTINRTVAGIIIDQETRKPISGVKVYSSELGFETTTDKNGYYFIHLNKQATILPRIFMTHPQYLTAMMFDGSYDKQTDIEHTLVLFMGMQKGNPNNTTKYTTSSLAQQYTLTTNKTPGYEQVNEILNQWLEKYDHQRDRAQADEYIDRVKVNEGIMNWTLVKNSKKHPLILLEKRVIGKDLNAVEKQVKMSDMYEFEFIAHGELLKQYGDDAKDGIVNIITKANKDNQTVRLVPKKKISEEELTAMLAEAAKLNVLYVGIENTLKIQVENIPANELEVKLEGGIVIQRNGIFYAIPQTNEGENAKVDIYKKLKNGQTQLLNSRYFRVRALPQKNNSLLVSL